MTSICIACSNSDPTDLSSAEEENTLSTMSSDFIQLVPDGELTHEDLINGISDLCKSAQDSYSLMLEASQDKQAPRKGIRFAKKVQKQYEDRLNELSSLDYSSMTDDEIIRYTSEISEIISAIREARDLLNDL